MKFLDRIIHRHHSHDDDEDEAYGALLSNGTIEVSVTDDKPEVHDDELSMSSAPEDDHDDDSSIEDLDQSAIQTQQVTRRVEKGVHRSHSFDPNEVGAQLLSQPHHHHHQPAGGAPSIERGVARSKSFDAPPPPAPAARSVSERGVGRAKSFDSAEKQLRMQHMMRRKDRLDGTQNLRSSSNHSRSSNRSGKRSLVARSRSFEDNNSGKPRQRSLSLSSGRTSERPRSSSKPRSSGEEGGRRSRSNSRDRKTPTTSRVSRNRRMVVRRTSLGPGSTPDKAVTVSLLALLDKNATTVGWDEASDAKSAKSESVLGSKHHHQRRHRRHSHSSKARKSFSSETASKDDSSEHSSHHERRRRSSKTGGVARRSSASEASKDTDTITSEHSPHHEHKSHKHSKKHHHHHHHSNSHRHHRHRKSDHDDEPPKQAPPQEVATTTAADNVETAGASEGGSVHVRHHQDLENSFLQLDFAAGA